MFEFIRFILSESFFRRLIAICLLPNVLVWGFNMVGIANRHNPIWVNFLSPYWFIETLIFKIALAGLGLYFLKQVFEFLRSVVAHEMARKEEEEHLRYLEQSRRERAEEEARKERQAVFAPATKPSQAEPPKPQPLTAEEVKKRVLAQFTGGDY